MAALIQFIYVSSAAEDFSSENLVMLLDHSRLKNQAARITGMLLFHDGSFIQVLEGEQHQVLATHSRIAQDPRPKTQSPHYVVERSHSGKVLRRLVYGIPKSKFGRIAHRGRI
jgi:hypothetical protein